MKLLDILARELKAWPEDCEAIEQDLRGTCLFKVGGHAISTYVPDIADDAETSKVTRAEWQAAVEALKAEQAAELKWPDGATHFTPRQPGNSNSVFWKVENGKAVTGWPYYGGEFHSPSTDIPEDKVWQYPDTIPRPTEPAVEWDGAGFPPVGAEIEALLQGIGSTTYFWQRAKVVHGALPESGGEILVFSLETTRPAWVDEFRPIRTA